MSNTRKAKPSIDALLAGAKLPERTVALCVRGDLAAEVERLDRTLAASASGDARLTGNPEARTLATKIESVREQMKDSTVEVVLRALSRRDFQKFVATHQPRESDIGDRAVGFNRETFHEDLVRLSIVAPEISPEQWDSLSDAMTSAQWNEFVQAVNELNMESVSVPFSRASSQVLQG